MLASSCEKKYEYNPCKRQCEGEQEKETDNEEKEEEEEEAEEEPEELVDPHEKIREHCAKKKECVYMKNRLDLCNARVESKSKTAETCVEEVINYMHCVEDCAAKTLFSQLK